MGKVLANTYILAYCFKTHTHTKHESDRACLTFTQKKIANAYYENDRTYVEKSTNVGGKKYENNIIEVFHKCETPT